MYSMYIYIIIYIYMMAASNSAPACLAFLHVAKASVTRTCGPAVRLKVKCSAMTWHFGVQLRIEMGRIHDSDHHQLTDLMYIYICKYILSV